MKTTATGRQPLGAARATRSSASGTKSRFGFVVPPAGAENDPGSNAAAAAPTAAEPPPAVVGKLQKPNTIKGAGVVIPRRRPAVGGSDGAAASASAAGTKGGGGLVPVDEEAAYQQQQEEEEMISAIQEMAVRTFGEPGPDNETERLARGKLTFNPRWDYKEKITRRDEAIRALRTGMAALLTEKDEFVQACVDVEMALRNDMRKGRAAQALVGDLTARNRAVETQLEALKAERNDAVNQAAAHAKNNEDMGEEVAQLKSDLSQTRAFLESTQTEAATAQAARADLAEALKKHEAEAQGLKDGLGKELAETKAALEAMRTERDGLKDAKAALEKEVAELTGTLKEGQGRSVAEAGERARLEQEAVKLTEELKTLRDAVAARGEEVASAKLDAEKRVGELQQELAQKEGSRREVEAAKAHAEAEQTELKAKLESVRGSMEEKDKELSMALKSFADMQRSAQEREGELRQASKDGEERVARAEARATELEAEVGRLRTDVAASAGETAALKVELTAKREELKAQVSADQETRAALQESRASLAVEKELRARAEGKEAEERQERVAANAQLLAMQQAHAVEMEGQRAEKTKALQDWEHKVHAAEQERETLLKEIRDAQEAALTFESELKTLRRALEDAESRTEQLQELAQISGEAEVLRHRLVEADKDREMGAEKSRQQIAELEKAVLDGEVQRRKMHNLIQELRGNVRVYARVRPFLPSDQVDAGAEHCISVDPHDDSLAIVKRDGSSNNKALERHGFSFDKCFPPSAGQEAVFAEVSEFVQSALDGYNVCLFSYGQTGSGKTHTMQGFGHGPMKGIIPRAMEQVGRYKTMLESQGWVYEMEVSFIEIYQEQIKDLLRSLGSGGGEDTGTVAHDIKKDAKGNMFVTDVTMVQLDPNDPEEVHRIMDVASRHRSVGATSMNERSSRSHSVFTLHMRATNAERRSTLSGKLNLCDLAGSERLSRSNATGERLKETQAINKSLSSLTDVFVALSNRQAHVPYRNSKLTYLLQQCLSGDGKTLMLVNLSPTEQSYFESLCALRFASQVNKCELGQARKNVQVAQDSGSSTGPGSTTSSVSRASTLTAATASSSSRGGRK